MILLIDLAFKATVLLAVGFLFSFLLRQASAASRHTVWTTVFVAMLLLPVARTVMPEWGIIAVPDRLARLGAASRPIVASTEVRSTEVSSRPASVPAGSAASTWLSSSVLLAVWITGAAFSVVWIVAGLLGARRLERSARLVEDPRVIDRALRAAELLGVRRPVRLLAVSNDVMPSTWGVLAPRVLLPGGVREWTDTQLDAVLTHELSHVVRGDAASHLFARLTTALWWWHPMAWWASRTAKFERERACDDLVLTQGARASDYAADLVTFVSSLRSPRTESPATLAMARQSQLEGRVMAILKSDVNRRGVSQSAFMAALLVMALVWPLAAARPAAPAQQAPVRVGGNVAPPAKVKDVRPIYPAAAEAERRQGVVIIEAVIDATGTVDEAKVVRSIGEDLDNAAIDAVLQWRYRPTLLNGTPVPVIMTVTVNFALDADTGMPPPPPPPPPPPVSASVEMPPSPPPPPPPPGGSRFGSDDPALRIGGQIKAPAKIKHVDAVYPLIAQQARVTGVVIVEARIDEEGNVTDARVIRPVALLDEAARDAVLQWKFQPTHLNGVAVPVIMTVTVNFKLE